ncbi:hypothetical protein K491DRAFT_682863 [Lophiostoma macrostomum CBS 122681]|uniref:Uncharacterized protein n=1 Tax=Lophiostoma macrostomum CBS 122681 TaxID=1314788 RepID=A0A6A6SW13_9PLEO|nr:hypothetical protein K491DRAFT_682863 [Lophiostoma macrostomum CBS 122681]
MANQFFRFLDLPPELRLLVYKALPRQIKHHHAMVPSEPHPRHLTLITKVMPISILATCRFIHEEANDIVQKIAKDFIRDEPKLIVDCSSSFSDLRCILDLLQKSLASPRPPTTQTQVVELLDDTQKSRHGFVQIRSPLTRLALGNKIVRFGLSQYVLQYARHYLKKLPKRNRYDLVTVEVHIIPRFQCLGDCMSTSASEQAQIMRTVVLDLNSVTSSFRFKHPQDVLLFRTHGCLIDGPEPTLSASQNPGSSDAWKETLKDASLIHFDHWKRVLSDENWQEEWLE